MKRVIQRCFSEDAWVMCYEILLFDAFFWNGVGSSMVYVQGMIRTRDINFSSQSLEIRFRSCVLGAKLPQPTFNITIISKFTASRHLSCILLLLRTFSFYSRPHSHQSQVRIPSLPHVPIPKSDTLYSPRDAISNAPPRG